MEGNWWKGAGAADYVFLKEGRNPHEFNLTFADRGKNVFGKQKKAEWVVAYLSDKQKVVYQFDGTKLERKATAGGKHENAVTACEGSENTFQILVTVEARKLVSSSTRSENTHIYNASDIRLTQ